MLAGQRLLCDGKKHVDRGGTEEVGDAYQECDNSASLLRNRVTTNWPLTSSQSLSLYF
jgi:hypothetical protein